MVDKDGDTNGKELGRLTRVDDKEAPIFRGGSHYIVAEMIKISKKHFAMCLLTKRVYYDDVFKGIAKTTSKGKYKIV